MRPTLRLKDKQKSCAIWVGYLLRVALAKLQTAQLLIKLPGKSRAIASTFDPVIIILIPYNIVFTQITT